MPADVEERCELGIIKDNRLVRAWKTLRQILELLKNPGGVIDIVVKDDGRQEVLREGGRATPAKLDRIHRDVTGSGTPLI